jgi:hypothetical protein
VVDGVMVYGDAAARIEVERDDVVLLSPATVFRNRREPRVVAVLVSWASRACTAAVNFARK